MSRTEPRTSPDEMGLWESAWRLLIGRPRDFKDPRVFHKISLAVFLCIVSLNVVNPDIIRHERSGPVMTPNVHEGRLQESWNERVARMELQIGIQEEPGKAAGPR